MYFILTSAGRLAQEAAGGTPLSLGSFRLGGLAGYTPTEGLTDLQGTVVATGIPSAPLLQSSNVFKYVITMDGSIGDFQFGEVGLFLPDNTLYAIGVNSSLISKVQATSTNAGSKIIVIECYVMPSGFIYGQLSSDARVSLPVLGSLDNLPPAASSMSNVYLVEAPTLSPSSVIVTTDGLNWTIHGYEAKILDLTVVSATSTIINFATNVPIALPQYTGELVLVCTSGMNVGTVRTINYGSSGSNSYTLNQAYLISCQAGDTFSVYERTILDNHVYRFLSGLDPDVPIARVNDFKVIGLDALLRIDGSNKPTANLDFNHVRIANVGMPSVGRDAINLDFLNTALDTLSQSLLGQIAGGVIQSGYGPPTGSTPQLPPLYADRATVPNTLYAFLAGGWSKASSESVRFGSGVPDGTTPIVPPVYCNTDNNQAVVFFYIGGNWRPLSLGYGSIINSNLDITGNVTIGSVASNYLTLNGGVLNIPNDLNLVSGRSLAINSSSKRVWGTTFSYTIGVSGTQSSAYEFVRNGALAGGMRYDALSSTLMIGAAANNTLAMISNGVVAGKGTTAGEIYLGSNADNISLTGVVAVSSVGGTNLAVTIPVVPTLGSTVGTLSFGGTDDSLKNKAKIEVVANEAWSVTSMPTRINFVTTQSGSTLPIVAMYIDDDRQVYTSTHLNVGGNAVVSGYASIDGGLLLHKANDDTNTLYGLNAGNAIASTFTRSTAVGSNALAALGVNGSNTAVGAEALKSTVVGLGNTAIGDAALKLDTLGSFNTAVGYNALSTGTLIGNNNVAVGSNSAASYTGTRSVFIGSESGQNTTSTPDLTAVGFQSLKLSTGDNNSALGSKSLSNNTVGHDNTALGTFALRDNVVSHHNTAVGSSVLMLSTTGDWNTAVGSTAFASLSGGTDNVAIGYGVGTSATVANENAFVGSRSAFSITTGSRNATLGYASLQSSSTGTDIVAVGYQALKNSTANGNTAVGSNALVSSISGVGLTAVGNSALQSSTGNHNTAIGYLSADSITTGSNNTSVGSASLSSNTTGSNNTVVGAASCNTLTGEQNTVVGADCLTIAGTASYNTALGYGVLKQLNVLSNNNIGIGANSLSSANLSSRNIAIGNNSLFSTTEVNDTLSVGYESLYSLTAGTLGGIQNIFLGNYSGRNLVEAQGNAVVGYHSLHTATGSSYNAVLGNYALNSLGLGMPPVFGAPVLYGRDENVAVGNYAAYSLEAGDRNVLIGHGVAPTLQSGGDNIILGINASGTRAGSTLVSTSRNILIGADLQVMNQIFPNPAITSLTLTDTVILGYASTSTYLMASGAGGWQTFSDERLKHDIYSLKETIPSARAVLRNIDPKTFRLNSKSYQDGRYEIGFSAQNIIAALGEDTNNKLQVVGTQFDHYTLSPTTLIPMLVAASNEQESEIEDLKKQVADLTELVNQLLNK